MSPSFAKKCLQKFFNNTIAKPNLINYIYNIETTKNEVNLFDSAIDNIKDAMGSWDMNSVSVSSNTYGDVVVVSVRVADGKVDAITSDCDVDEAYNMLDRLGLLIADQDDGYFPNHNTGLVDYDERLKSGYRNPTGFRRWVKVAKSRGCCYTCKHDRDVNAAKNILVEGLRQIA